MLATAGCVAGLLLATWSLAFVVKLWPQGSVRFEDAWLAPPVLIFGIVMALTSTVLFSLGPGLSLARVSVAASLQDRGGSPGRFAVRVREWLVGIELALATALLIAAGLMIKSFWMMTETRVPPTPERILVTQQRCSTVWGSRSGGHRRNQRRPRRGRGHHVLDCGVAGVRRGARGCVEKRAVVRPVRLPSLLIEDNLRIDDCRPIPRVEISCRRRPLRWHLR